MRDLPLDEIRRKGLLEGQDQIARAMTRIAEIDAYQAADRERRPWIYDTAAS